MCANVADKRPLRMNTLANGECVSAAYTQPDAHVHTHTHTDGHTNCRAHQMPFCLDSHANVHVPVCVMLKHFSGHDLALQPRQISIILEK